MHMANISAAMAIELIGNVGEQNDQNMRLLPIEADKHERLLFVISQTGRMADELYLAFPRREARR
jgi:hypothetical protein